MAFLLCSDKVKYPLVVKCEVGGQQIFVRDSFQINLHCERKKSQDKKLRTEMTVIVIRLPNLLSSPLHCFIGAVDIYSQQR